MELRKIYKIRHFLLHRSAVQRDSPWLRCVPVRWSRQASLKVLYSKVTSRYGRRSWPYGCPVEAPHPARHHQYVVRTATSALPHPPFPARIPPLPPVSSTRCGRFAHQRCRRLVLILQLSCAAPLLSVPAHTARERTHLGTEVTMAFQFVVQRISFRQLVARVLHGVLHRRRLHLRRATPRGERRAVRAASHAGLRVGGVTSTARRSAVSASPSSSRVTSARIVAAARLRSCAPPRRE